VDAIGPTSSFGFVNGALYVVRKLARGGACECGRTHDAGFVFTVNTPPNDSGFEGWCPTYFRLVSRRRWMDAVLRGLKEPGYAPRVPERVG
jgi:hypothetical protein